MTKPMLFTPITLRGLTLKNRVVIAPMCQYSAIDGLANDWHFAHLAKFAMGGAAAVLTEAAAVQERGRITHGDLGIWSDAHAEALKPVVAFIRTQGAAPGIQLGHAGRKASMQRPWFGNGPLGAEDEARGDTPWTVNGASAIPLAEGWLTPVEMTARDIAKLVENFVAATRRSNAAGFEFIELHGAHGYLIQSFLSPLSNRRTDKWGGDLAGRMKLALDIAWAVREAWPKEKPLFFRISSIDGIEGGWEIEDSVALCHELKRIGVDVIDCSSMGNSAGGATANPMARGAGFQTPFSKRIRAETGIATQAVGLILDGPMAEEVLQDGRSDLIAIGREALYDPFWAHHQAREMGVEGYDAWPEQYGWWLERREGAIRRINENPDGRKLPAA
ncbi:NADH:flavin oxidoreductase/NADH oxidase [Pikeienuella piscinae]|uniref:NADH:flavin oxidoreductase/NADH oxidase n=1 Tax=Pikeienuella piscinae TaxID=2748098 RepID=A0A7L5C0R2_9RHOB|nr:NADH:flavin oxidoreductase/NADH oxidase [Pikeienuella piscinae]QIE56357.1 NADH:flavin oxidoreductase/NADH oxidase [Pikeienuella piscinae]